MDGICIIYIPLESCQDRRIWPLSKSDQLTIKSAYGMISSTNAPNISPTINWNGNSPVPLPRRVLLFGRKCLVNSNLVRASISSEINSVDAFCPIHTKMEELVCHALMQCDHPMKRWVGSHLDLQTHNFSCPSLMRWWKEFCEHGLPSSPLSSEHSKMWILTIVINSTPFRLKFKILAEI